MIDGVCLEEGLKVKFVPKGPRDKYYAEAMKNAGQVVAIHSLTCDYGDHDEDKHWLVIAFLEDIGDGWMEVHLEDLERV